jgi:riboflavin kinase/FMN adenylyltransferase
MKEKTIYALGFFDGVHLGHGALLQECRRMADKHCCKAAAVTFSSHPDTLVLVKTPPLINTIEDRVRLLKAAGMDDVIVLPFDRQMQTMPWQEFLSLLVEHYGATGLVCGHDFRFGNRGEGNALLLQNYCEANGMPWAVVPEQTLEGMTISSTHIRSLLERGQMEEAERFLGHPHMLTGEVVSGRKLGRTLGVPTANISIPEGVVQLPFGVYACKAITEGTEYLAVTNIGNRPTVGGHRITVEPWLLDFEGDLYGKALTLSFYCFLRPEQKFPSLDALKEEIQKNAAQTRKFFENNTK